MNDDFSAFMCGLLLALGLGVMMHGCSMTGSDNSWRTQIVEHGCAEYYLDANHDRQWRWKQ